MKLSRSSMRPLDLEPYLKALNEYFDNMDKIKDIPRSALMEEARKFHDELLSQYPSTIEVKVNDMKDLKELVSTLGTVGLSKTDDGEFELYIIE